MSESKFGVYTINDVLEILNNSEYYYSFGKHPEFGFEIRIYNRIGLKARNLKIFTGKTLDDCALSLVEYIKSKGES